MYDIMYQLFCLGWISPKEWEDYCITYFDNLLKENEEVLKRMKEN